MKLKSEILTIAKQGGYNVGVNTDAEILLDPAFFSAIGKVKGWKLEYYCNYCNSLSSRGCPDDCAYFIGKKPEWHYNWHRFIDKIAEKDLDHAIEWLYNLIKE